MDRIVQVWTVDHFVMVENTAIGPILAPARLCSVLI